jgi:hypothetical protein
MRRVGSEGVEILDLIADCLDKMRRKMPLEECGRG